MARARRAKLNLVVGLAAVVVVVAVGGAPAAQAVTLRKQVEQRGDFIFIGNTGGWDCGMNGVPAPIVGTVPAAAMCGPPASLQDTSPDVLWRSDHPPGGATASAEFTSGEARSTAVLELPPGATVTYARLYWGAMKDGGTAGTSVLVEREGGASPFSVRARADASYTVLQTPTRSRVYYNSTADITELVAAHGSGPYRVGGIETVPLAGLSEFTAFVSWSIVVFYRRDSEPQRNLALFDGLDLVRPMDHPRTAVTLRGFHVPPTGFDGKLGVLAYEGDIESSGDYITFNGTLIFNDSNPPTNFFNGTRSHLGSPVTVAGDLPQLTGTAASHSGIDMDVVDVTALLKRDDTQATIEATSSGDNYLLAAFITSISSLKPEFSNSAKTVRDLTRPPGPVRPGDTVEYTIVVQNDGNDAATGVVLTDVLPAGITYLPGSLKITGGANAGDKTDAAGDDQGEYEAGTRTLRVRLGTGADAASGGVMEVGETTAVVFRATIDPGTSGTTIYNQATISAAGRAGNPATDYPTNPGSGGMGTPLPVDECGEDGDCPMARPFCLTSATPNICVECRDDSSCPVDRPICSASRHVCVPMCAADPDCPLATPACLPSGVCGQCSAQNSTACTGLTPVCDLASGRCVQCLTDLGCPASRPMCDPMTRMCVGCATGADCPPAAPVCDPMTRMCVSCTSDAMCGGTTPVCDGASRSCRGCRADGECPAASPACLATGACGECSATNRTRCPPERPLCDLAASRCVGCSTSADCPSPTAPLCDPVTGTCIACQGDGPPGCPDPARPACQRTGPLAGACTECSGSNTTRCGGFKPQCLTDLGLCGCSDRDGDSECGGPQSGVVCSGPAGVCVPGCSSAPGRNGCPAPLVCAGEQPQPPPPRPGSCVLPPGCTGDDQCPNPWPICDPSSIPRMCVQCLVDGQCPAPLLCDQTGSRLCVECTATRTTNCQATLAGSRCLPGNICGCRLDSDCGGPTSGRVCDQALSRCTIGCRGAGGNGCPAGLVCSSTGAGIGPCAPLTDGGVDAGADAAAPPDAGRDAGVPPLDARPRDGLVDVRPVDAGPAPAPDAAARDASALEGGRDLAAPRDAVITSDQRAGRRGFLGGGGCVCTVPGAAGGAGGAGRAGGAGPGPAPGVLALVVALALLGRGRRRRCRATRAVRGGGHD